jgi:hypothetical protein
MSYAEACRRAAEEQGLAPFLDAEGWTVEQTGGFTMVACRYLPAELEGAPPSHVWTVTSEGDGYYACRQTVTGWTHGEEPPEDAYRQGLSLAEALALGEDA